MNKEIVKKGYELAEKELKEKQISEVKEIVKKTLENIADVEKDIDKLQERKKYLKLDLDDLKQGRLDRIEERQEKDPEAKKYALVLIIKEIIREQNYSPWFIPYKVVWNEPYIPVRYYTGGNCLTTIAGNGNSFSNASCGSVNLCINSSVAKDYAAGAYDVDGRVVNFR